MNGSLLQDIIEANKDTIALEKAMSLMSGGFGSLFIVTDKSIYKVISRKTDCIDVF